MINSFTYNAKAYTTCITYKAVHTLLTIQYGHLRYQQC